MGAGIGIRTGTGARTGTGTGTGVRARASTGAGFLTPQSAPLSRPTVRIHIPRSTTHNQVVDHPRNDEIGNELGSGHLFLTNWAALVSTQSLIYASFTESVSART